MSVPQTRLLLSLLLVLGVAWGPTASGAADLREFAGVVVSVSGSALSVENRMGDRRSFAGSGATRVGGAKKSWQALAKGDPVIVYWDLRDEPVRAHRVRVLQR